MKPAIKRTIRLFCAGLALAFFASVLHAKTSQEIKAAYAFSFLKFTDWSHKSDSSDTYELCFIGKDIVNDALNDLDGRNAGNRTLSIKKLNSYSDIGSVLCHGLYVGESEAKFLDNILDMALKKSVLTISSIKGFVSEGGMIELITLGNVIRFKINLKHIREASLSIHSNVLELAEEVIR